MLRQQECAMICQTHGPEHLEHIDMYIDDFNLCVWRFILGWLTPSVMITSI